MTKTIQSVCQRSGISQRLIRGVLRQLGGGEDAKSNLRDVANHGADAGYCGFTYYSDTVDFFRRYRADIVELIKSEAREFGQEAITLVASFRCLDNGDESIKESIARCLYGGRLRDEDDIVANARAWVDE